MAVTLGQINLISLLYYVQETNVGRIDPIFYVQETNVIRQCSFYVLLSVLSSVIIHQMRKRSC